MATATILMIFLQAVVDLLLRVFGVWPDRVPKGDPMPVRQVRVFVPSSEPLGDWSETLIGRVFRPLTTEYSGEPDWFWFSRYGANADDSGDCDISLIPPDFKIPLAPGGTGFHRSMRLRFKVADDNRCVAFEKRAAQLIRGEGYGFSDFRDYNFIGDLGCDRFLGSENRLQGRTEHRAQLATSFLWVTSQLVIDALVGPDSGGRYRLETNDDVVQNPRGSSFQSLLHMFCNITDVPTDVHVYRKATQDLTGYGTFIYSPEAPEGGWDDHTRFPIRY